MQDSTEIKKNENDERRRRRVLFIIIILIIGLGGTVIGFFLLKGGPIEAESQVSINPYEIDSIRSAEYDMLLEVLAFNSDTSIQIPLSFRSGDVQAIKFEDYLTKTDYGYVIKLKDSTPILTPLIIDNQIFVPGGFGSRNYYSFNINDGSLAWAVTLDDDGPSSAVRNGSSIVFNTESCTIFCLDILAGNMKWSYWLGDPLLSNPIESDGKIYTTYSNYDIHADTTIKTKHPKIRPSHPLICMTSNGHIQWQKWLDGDAICSPIVYKDDLFIATLSGTLYRINKDDGEILACSKLNATSLPVIHDDKVFIAMRNEKNNIVYESIAILDHKTLKFIKEINSVSAPYLNADIQRNSELNSLSTELDAGNGFFGTPITAGGLLASANTGLSNVSSLQSFLGSIVLPYNNYIICNIGEGLYCLNPKDGSVIWKTKLSAYNKSKGGRMNTAPIRAGNQLIIVSLVGDVQLFDIKTGKLTKTYSIQREVRNQPIVSNGRIFIPTMSGELHCIETGDKSIDGWRMFMKNPDHAIN